MQIIYAEMDDGTRHCVDVVSDLFDAQSWIDSRSKINMMLLHIVRFTIQHKD